MVANSIERLDPEEIGKSDTISLDSYKLHLERYAFAAKHCTSGQLLDIACGLGYGTAELSKNENIAALVGVDIDQGAVSIATSRYSSRRIGFLQSDALDYMPSQKFDAVVSLETVEHLTDPHRFLEHVGKNLLRQGGTFIPSVPVTPSMDFNPYHLSDFSPRTFRAAVEAAGFEIIDALHQVQPYNPFAVLRSRENHLKDGRRNLLAYYLRNPSKLGLRVGSVFKDGFANKYLTLACVNR